MTSTRTALFAAAACVALWASKAVAIGVAGGLARSPLESPLFFAGLLSLFVACGSLGVALTRGRPLWLRVLTAAVAAPVAVFAFAMLVDASVAALRHPGPDRPWAWTELNLWVASATTLALTVAVRRRLAPSDPPSLGPDAAPQGR